MSTPELAPLKAAIEAFLKDYLAITHHAMIECIFAQGDWQYIPAQTEKYAGMAEDDAMAETAGGFAMSALVECHEGPHLTTCPDHRPTPNSHAVRVPTEGDTA